MDQIVETVSPLRHKEYAATETDHNTSWDWVLLGRTHSKRGFKVELSNDLSLINLHLINSTIDILSPVDDSLVQILKLRFAKNFEPCFWSRYWSWSFVKILMYIFGQDFEAEVWSRFWSWILTNLWHDLKTGISVKAGSPWVRWSLGNV